MIREGDVRLRSVSSGWNCTVGVDDSGESVKAWGATRRRAEENALAAVRERAEQEADR
jgi:hypothetical protein